MGKKCRGEEGQRPCTAVWEILGKCEAKGDQSEWKNEKDKEARNNENKERKYWGRGRQREKRVSGRMRQKIWKHRITTTKKKRKKTNMDKESMKGAQEEGMKNEW